MRYPTWRSIPKGEQHRYISDFMRIRPEQVASLPITELVLLLQWVLDQRGLFTVEAEILGEYFDLELLELSKDREEYARIYFAQTASAVYDLTTQLQGSDVKKIYLFTLDRFSPADRNAQNISPLFLELREREDLIRLVRDAQAHYRRELRTRHDFYVITEAQIGKSRIASLWSRLQRSLRNLMAT